MRNTHLFTLYISLLILLLTACGPVSTQIKPQPTVIINPSFQARLTQVPAVPTYQCGAWSSNNAPEAYSTINIYAKLTKAVKGISGATASAIVHFKYMDISLDQRPVSDSGGFVTFTLPLEGHQPHQVPATIDVSFMVEGKRVTCTPAFFTPQ